MEKFFELLVKWGFLTVVSYTPIKGDLLFKHIHTNLLDQNLAKRVSNLLIIYTPNKIQVIINTPYLLMFNTNKQNELRKSIEFYLQNNPIKTLYLNTSNTKFKLEIIVNDFRLHSENINELGK